MEVTDSFAPKNPILYLLKEWSIQDLYSLFQHIFTLIRIRIPLVF